MAIRSLTSQGLLMVQDRDFLMVPESDPARVRVPTDNDETRRRVDEVPAAELRAAIEAHRSRCDPCRAR